MGLKIKPSTRLRRRVEAHSHRKSAIDDAKRAAIAREIIDEGKTWDQVQAEYGVSSTIVRGAIARERGRREPQVDASTLSMTARQKLEAAINQEKRRLQAEFHQAVQAELKQAIDKTVLPQYLKEMAEARQIIESRKGLMGRETYRLILSCLHPDRVEDTKLKERYTKAFHSFSSLELVLCHEKEMPTAAPKMPRTYEQMMRARAETMARRRKSSNGVQQKSL